MTLLDSDVRVLVRKEFRQFVRSRSAVFSTFLMPVLLLLVLPAIELSATSRRAAGGNRPGPGSLGGRAVLVYYLLPIFVVLAGLLGPAMTAIHTIVVERERRTVELLVSLPVSVRHIVLAKLVATIVLAGVVMLPLAVVDAVAGGIVGGGGPLYTVLLLALLAGAVIFSVCTAFTLAIVARDYRTSQQVNALFVIPVMLVTTFTLSLLPGNAGLAALAVVLAIAGGAGLLIAARAFTFERYLS